MAALVSMASMARASLTPTVSVAIAVDTAAIAAAGDGPISSGVFMMDNRVRNGSTEEGQIALHTQCNAGDLIGFQVMPVGLAGGSGNTAVMTSFAKHKGDDVFTGAGHPRQEPSPKGLPSGAYWIGQAIAAGTEHYQIQIKITVGALQPTDYYVTWVAILTAQ